MGHRFLLRNLKVHLDVYFWLCFSAILALDFSDRDLSALILIIGIGVIAILSCSFGPWKKRFHYY